MTSEFHHYTREEFLDEFFPDVEDKAAIAGGMEQLRAKQRARHAERIVEALNSVEMDFSDSAAAWRYGGGRDLARLAENAPRL